MRDLSTGYFKFLATGEEGVDRLLAAVVLACRTGVATWTWGDASTQLAEFGRRNGLDGASPAAWIHNAADDLAGVVGKMREELADLRSQPRRVRAVASELDDDGELVIVTVPVVHGQPLSLEERHRLTAQSETIARYEATLQECWRQRLEAEAERDALADVVAGLGGGGVR